MQSSISSGTNGSSETSDSWGNPLNVPLDTLIDNGTLPTNRLWGDVIHFRAGQYFRETRFYVFSSDTSRLFSKAFIAALMAAPIFVPSDNFSRLAKRKSSRACRSRTITRCC